MSKRYPGGFVTKSPVAPTTSAASGVWTLEQATQYIKAGTWPIVIGGPYWIGLLGGTGYQYGYQTKVDVSGNVYLVGYNDASGYGQLELAKYNTSGVLQWQRSLGVNFASGYGFGLALDSLSNAYIVGWIGSTPATQLAKYNSSGVIQWQRSLSGTTYTRGQGIAVDSSSNVYIVGWYNDPSTYDFVQLAKYDTSGAIQWQKTLGGPGSERGYGIAVDSSSNVYITGSTSPDGSLIAKYDTSGSLQWQRGLGTNGSSGRSIAVDSTGNVYTCGFVFGSFANELRIAKYNSSGTIQWQRSLGSVSQGYGYGISVDSSSNAYIIGIYGTDIQVAKYNSSGTIQWQRSLSSTGTDQGNGTAIDSSGNLYIIGQSDVSGTPDFIFAKLPSDGSLTGTYTIGGYSFTYAASSLTNTVTSYTDVATSLTSATSTLTDAASTRTDAASSLTSSVTTIP